MGHRSTLAFLRPDRLTACGAAARRPGPHCGGACAPFALAEAAPDASSCTLASCLRGVCAWCGASARDVIVRPLSQLKHHQSSARQNIRPEICGLLNTGTRMDRPVPSCLKSCPRARGSRGARRERRRRAEGLAHIRDERGDEHGSRDAQTCERRGRDAVSGAVRRGRSYPVPSFRDIRWGREHGIARNHSVRGLRTPLRPGLIWLQGNEDKGHRRAPRLT